MRKEVDYSLSWYMFPILWGLLQSIVFTVFSNAGGVLLSLELPPQKVSNQLGDGFQIRWPSDFSYLPSLQGDPRNGRCSIASDSFCTKNKIKRNPKAIRPRRSTFANFQKQAPNTNTKQFWPEPSFKYSIPWTSFVLLVPHWPKAATQFTDHGMTFHLTSTPASG